MSDLEHELRSQFDYVRDHLNVATPRFDPAIAQRRGRRSVRVVVASILGTGAAVGGSIALVGALTGPPSHPSPTKSATVSTTTTTTTSPPASTTTESPNAPQNLDASPALKATLLSSFDAYTGDPTSYFTGTTPGSVYYALDPGQDKYWAFATFQSSAPGAAFLKTSPGQPDAAIFTSTPGGGGWTVATPIEEPSCDFRVDLPEDIQILWNLPSSSGCADTSSGSTSLGSFLPMFPFSNYQDVLQSEQGLVSGGHQPWVGNPVSVAQSFIGIFLDQDDARIVSVKMTGNSVYVAIGATPSGGSAPASVVSIVHVVRWGPLWEVVGAQSADLTITEPTYGSDVSNSATQIMVSGDLTQSAADTLDVVVLSQSATQAEAQIGSSSVGDLSGTNVPWSASVSIGATTSTLLAVVAKTESTDQSVQQLTVTALSANGGVSGTR